MQTVKVTQVVNVNTGRKAAPSKKKTRRAKKAPANRLTQPYPVGLNGTVRTFHPTTKQLIFVRPDSTGMHEVPQAQMNLIQRQDLVRAGRFENAVSVMNKRLSETVMDQQADIAAAYAQINNTPGNPMASGVPHWPTPSTPGQVLSPQSSNMISTASTPRSAYTVSTASTPRMTADAQTQFDDRAHTTKDTVYKQAQHKYNAMKNAVRAQLPKQNIPAIEMQHMVFNLNKGRIPHKEKQN